MSASIESKASWVVAGISLAILGIAFGGPWIVVVALKIIAAETGGARSVPAFASSLAWFGAGLGGIAMGQIADRYGIRWTVMFGTVMIAIGFAISSFGEPWFGQTWSLLYRPRPVHRPDRQCRPQCAGLCLRQPLVRQAARLGVGPDRERPIHRGRAVAAVFRARNRHLWLAHHDDRVRPVSGGDHPSARGGLPQASARSGAASGPRSPMDRRPQPYSAGRPISCSRY